MSTFIIAEAGVNHNGNMDYARKLVDIASEAGANAVKFQKFHTEELVSLNARKADYQVKSTGDDEGQFEMIKRLELDMEAHRQLLEYARSKNIMFLSSPFDTRSINELNELGMPIFKVPSGEINNLPYLQMIGSYNKKVILSTGMCEMPEIEWAVKTLQSAGTDLDNITVLHCNTEYPTPFKDVNLLAMLSIGRTLGVKIGYSDHTPGIEVPVAAVALGATVIEKHFTIDKDLPGPDHKASLSPGELKEMVTAIRNIEIALGDGIKKPSASEMNNISIVRKSIVARKAIKKGEVFGEDNITVKRPGTGLNPMKWHEVIGTTARRDYAPDDLIEL